MSYLPVFQKKYTIGISDVDFKKTLKLSTLFNYFQETADLHSASLDLGIETISTKYGVTWVLVKIKVEIERLPEWKEEISIETWNQRPKKFEFERDYIAKDINGKIIARSISSWIVLDINTRELRKSDLLPITYSEFNENRALEAKLGKLKPFEEPKLSYKKKIGYSDIDINGHLNNSKYIDYIMDCFPLEGHDKYKVKSIQVNYVNEALPGDIISLNSDISTADSHYIYIEGINDSKEVQVFSAMVGVEPR